MRRRRTASKARCSRAADGDGPVIVLKTSSGPRIRKSSAPPPVLYRPFRSAARALLAASGLMCKRPRTGALKAEGGTMRISLHTLMLRTALPSSPSRRQWSSQAPPSRETIVRRRASTRRSSSGDERQLGCEGASVGSPDAASFYTRAAAAGHERELGGEGTACWATTDWAANARPLTESPSSSGGSTSRPIGPSSASAQAPCSAWCCSPWGSGPRFTTAAAGACGHGPPKHRATEIRPGRFSLDAPAGSSHRCYPSARPSTGTRAHRVAQRRLGLRRRP